MNSKENTNKKNESILENFKLMENTVSLYDKMVVTKGGNTYDCNCKQN